MNTFLIIQFLFDAVLLFGVLFLFHYSVHKNQGKKEDEEILKNVQVQEIKENLQELLLTLKQLGKEVSDNIQEQVKEAEEKTEVFKKIIQKLNKDLNKTLVLADEVGSEKTRLEEKIKIMKTAKKRVGPLMPMNPESKDSKTDYVKGLEKAVKIGKGQGFPGVGTVGFSSALVREVYRLADTQLEINEIIRKTKLSRAEVQLILNLRDNRFTTPN
jgi:hypothetical protein